MILVLDPCKLAFMPNPEGGLLQISDVEGLEGNKILIPIAEESLKALDAEIQKRLSGKVLDLSGDIASAAQANSQVEGLKG